MSGAVELVDTQLVWCHITRQWSAPLYVESAVWPGLLDGV